MTVLGVGTFGGASRIDATSGAVLATAFSVAQGIKPEIAISTIAVPVAALLTYADILGRMVLLPLHTVLMRQSNALIIKELNATTFLVRFLGLSLVPFQSS